MRLTPFLASFLAWALTGIVIFIVGVSFYSLSIETFVESRRAYSQHKNLLSRYDGLLAREAEYQKQLTAYQQALSGQEIMQASVSSADRRMQEIIRSISGRSGLNPGTMRTLGVTNLSDQYKKIGLSLGTTGSYKAVMSFIQGVEASSPALRVKSLRLRRNSHAEGPLNISIQMDIEALFSEGGQP